MDFPIAPIVVEILFVPVPKLRGNKKIATESGNMVSKKARTIRFYTKKINSRWQIYVYCMKVKTLSVINCV